MSEGGIALGGQADRSPRQHHERARATGTRLARHRRTRPRDVLRRNFWFCMIDDPSTVCTRRGAIGVENILFESDYPHGDGTWPDTQQVIDDILSGLPVEEIRMITHENAAKLYRHPLPEVRIP